MNIVLYTKFKMLKYYVLKHLLFLLFLSINNYFCRIVLN